DNRRAKGGSMTRTLAIVFVMSLIVGLGANAQPPSGDVNCRPFGYGIASLALPGAGQWLNGQADQARFHGSIGAVNAVLGALFWDKYGPVALPAHLIWAGYSALDAAIYCFRAQQMERAERIAN
ncbi:MAG: hypothetical protein ABEK03_08970, partial [Candidatus Bipolaricaulia bacterium]